MSAADEDLEGQIDPFNTRDILRWIERERGKARSQVNWQVLKDWLEKLRLHEDDMHAQLFSALAALVHGIKSGEINQMDEESGASKLGDYGIAAADYLYDHIARVENGTHKG